MEVSIFYLCEMIIPWWKGQNYNPTTRDYFLFVLFSYDKCRFWYQKTQNYTYYYMLIRLTEDDVDSGRFERH